MDRAALADLLRTRRSRLVPADVGLLPGVRRRTPGLRRDEVATLAAISTDYYTRLEQQRGPHPSPPVLSSLARALRLTEDERDHLFFVAGQSPPPRHSTSSHVSPGLLHVLDRLGDTPAFVIDDLMTPLLQNAMSVALSGDLLALQGRQRNYTWRWFTDPAARSQFPPEDWDEHSRSHVADLRATHGRRGGAADIVSLVDDLLARSPEFSALWGEHEVAVRRADTKRYLHPEVGLVELLCERLLGDVSGQTLVVLFPKPGTDAAEKLELLRVIGTQDLTLSRHVSR
jgi:hypothetical protein